jgi:hypothetical protein
MLDTIRCDLAAILEAALTGLQSISPPRLLIGYQLLEAADLGFRSRIPRDLSPHLQAYFILTTSG